MIRSIRVFNPIKINKITIFGLVAPNAPPINTNPARIIVRCIGIILL